MKKFIYCACLGLLLSGVATAMDNVNVYGKFGAEFHSKFSDETYTDQYGQTQNDTFPKKGKTNFSFFLEATRNITPNFEIGAGIGYIYRKGVKVSGEFTGQEGREEPDGTYKQVMLYDSYKVPRYNSVPIYAIAKYNFEGDSNLRPYVKVDLGYSFNRMKKTVDFEKRGYVDNKLEEIEKYKGDFKVKNGLYAGVGLGVEYNNLLAELSYIRTSAKVTGKGIEDDGEVIEDTFKYNNKVLRFSVGYKFSY